MPAPDLSLAAFVLACLLAAASGSIFRAGPWYDTLRKPSWRPPNRLFGPVWLVLYAMIALSGWIVWRVAPADQALLPVLAYAVQLALNALWSFCFFGLRRPGLALLDMSALWLAILLTILVFQPVSPLAAALLLPYLLWVSFAWCLNLAIWRLNGPARQEEGAT